MAVYFHSTFYASLTAKQKNNPIVGYENLITSFTASAASMYPAANMLTPDTSEYYKSSSATSATITALMNGDQTISYVAICAHNLAGATVTIEVDDDPAFGSALTVLSSQVIPDNKPILVAFAEGSYEAIRITITGASTAPIISYVMAGKQLRIPENVYVNHRPINDALNTNVVNNRSQGGEYLGSIVLSEKYATQLSMDYIESSFYESDVKPWAEKMGSPFVLAYRPDGFPHQVAYCWFTRNVQRLNQHANGNVSFDVQYEAHREWQS